MSHNMNNKRIEDEEKFWDDWLKELRIKKRNNYDNN